MKDYIFQCFQVNLPFEMIIRLNWLSPPANICISKRFFVHLLSVWIKFRLHWCHHHAQYCTGKWIFIIQPNGSLLLYFYIKESQSPCQKLNWLQWTLWYYSGVMIFPISFTKESSFPWRMCWGTQSPCPLEESLYSSTPFLTQVTSSRLQNVLPINKYCLVACGLHCSPQPRHLSDSVRVAWTGISSSDGPSLLMQLNSCDDLLLGIFEQK